MHRSPIIIYIVCIASGLYAASERSTSPGSLTPEQQYILSVAQSELDHRETYNIPEIRPAITRAQLEIYASAREKAFQTKNISALGTGEATNAISEALDIADSITHQQGTTPNCGTVARSLTRHGITPSCIETCCAFTGCLSLISGIYCFFCIPKITMAASCVSVGLACECCCLATMLTERKWHQTYLNTLLPDSSTLEPTMTMDLENNNAEIDTYDQ